MLVGTTEVESPWDEATRAEAEALWEAEKLTCPLCGNLREECADPDGTWHANRHVCYASRALDVANRMWREKREGKPFHGGNEKAWAAKFSPATPFHYADGTRLWVSPFEVDPDDQFL